MFGVRDEGEGLGRVAQVHYLDEICTDARAASAVTQTASSGDENQRDTGTEKRRPLS